MAAKKFSAAVASAAALLATAPGMVAHGEAPAVEISVDGEPCILNNILAAAANVASSAVAPAQAAICEKGRDESGFFFCQGFTLYRW